ncbi:MAG: hypothetical protein K2I35_00550 [Duncaniella sp.]|nr:hypothetical protein [Duncaniella sp.]
MNRFILATIITIATITLGLTTKDNTQNESKRISGLTLVNVEALAIKEDVLNPNIGRGKLREDCHNEAGRITGSRCVDSSDPYDECDYSKSWGDC